METNKFKNLLADEIDNKAAFRRRKTEEYPSDKRNQRSADGLQRLADWVRRELPDDDSALAALRAYSENWWSDEILAGKAVDIIPSNGAAERLLLRFDFHLGPPTSTTEFRDFLLRLVASRLNDEANEAATALRAVTPEQHARAVDALRRAAERGGHIFMQPAAACTSWADTRTLELANARGSLGRVRVYADGRMRAL